MVYTVVSQRSAKSFSSKACSTEIDHETVLFDLESESPQRGMTWGSIGINRVIRSGTGLLRRQTEALSDEAHTWNSRREELDRQQYEKS